MLITQEAPEGAVALDLEISKTDEIVVVRCRGRIVFGAEADELRRVVLGSLNESKRIVLSLAAILYLDSSGVDTLVASFISARNRGAEIKFADLSSAVRRVLTSTNVHRLFEVHDSIEDAVKSFYLTPRAFNRIAADANTEEEIRRRAYELYEARGCEDGRDVQDWLEAEAEITRRTERAAA